jgi:catechol 2,3-dioxygenase-like lactoylglutathione lyase family enzyme
MIRGIKFVSVPVKHQDEALKFYTDSLGFKGANRSGVRSWWPAMD